MRQHHAKARRRVRRHLTAGAAAGFGPGPKTDADPGFIRRGVHRQPERAVLDADRQIMAINGTILGLGATRQLRRRLPDRSCLIERLAEQASTGLPEQGFGSEIGENDLARRIQKHKRDGSRFGGARRQGFAFPAQAAITSGLCANCSRAWRASFSSRARHS